MAPGKKQKKSKRKGSKDGSSSLSHIASQLIPTAIFAAVPRTPTNLAQTWPRRTPSRTPSPIAQAIGEAGNIGRVMLGDLSKRPPAELPEGQDEGSRENSGTQNGHRTPVDSDVEEVGYESVRDGKSFDKTTKYFRMSQGENFSGPHREEVEGATGEGSSSQRQHFYHVLDDHQNGQIVEPIYSRVDKKRKTASKQPSYEEKDERDSISEYSSSDDLTDVTSHDEESTVSGPRRRRSRKDSKKERHDNEDSVDGSKPSAKKSSMKRKTPDTIQEVAEEGDKEDGNVPPPIPPYLEDWSPEAPKRSNRKKGQTSTQDEVDGPGIPLPPIPDEAPEDRLTDEQRRALKVVERLGFEGVSQKLALSDLSEDDDCYMSPVVPKNTVDFNGRTTFEREQFKDTLTESPVHESEARIEEASLNLSHTFAGVDSLQVQEELQSPNDDALAGQEGSHGGFKTQARKANKVSSFVQLLNEQERHRQAESAARTPVKARRDASPSQSKIKESQSNIDPVFLQRLEEARQANEMSFAERQRQLETLVEQHQTLYQEQLEQQKIQQQWQQEVTRQQWKLQEQLRALEKMQQEYNENADHSPRETTVSESDVRLQRELVCQQQEFLQQQQEQLSKSQNQQAEALKQQEKLCDQIKHLEEQQKQLQSSVNLLSPAGEDLAEIKQQEQQIVNLLNEQRRQESELHRLHLLQQQRLEEQSNSFTHERKALEQNQEMLQLKIKEQEARSRQLEQALEEMNRKHADAEAEWRKQMSARTADAERSDKVDKEDDQDRVSTSRYDEDKVNRRDERGKHYNEREERRRRAPSDEYSHLDQTRYEYRDRGSELQHNELDERNKRSRRHISYADADTEGSWRDGRVGSSQGEGRGSRKSHRGHTEGHFGEETPTRDRSTHGKSDRKTRKTRDRRTESENVITRTRAEVTEVQVVRDDEVYRLSKGRIELLELEKSALMELNTSLQEENEALKQLALSLQKGSGVSSVVLQKQIKDLHQEQKVLRDTVHRLNVELSRYQAKYRPVSFEEVEGMALPYKKEAAPWLVNTKYLAPLFLAYDDRLKEKEQLIRTYGEELSAFKARVMEVVKENQQLHMSVSKSSTGALGPDEWQQLQEQAKLVVEENALLMEQQEIQDLKLKEMQRIHGQEVSKLSKRISNQEATQRRLETELDDMRRTHSNLMRKHEALVADQETKMPVQEHLKIMDDCRSVLEDLKAKAKLESEEYNSRLQAIQKEKSSIAIKFADAEARNTQLERELDAYKNSLKKSERKFLFLQRKLEHIQERELTAQETLSQVLAVAEKTAVERDNYVQFAKTQKVQQEKAASKILAGTQNIKGLEEKLQEYRKKATDKVAVATGRLREKEKEINKLKEQHETEINNLRGLVRQKQRQLELMIGENRNVDKELELVWRNAAADNKRMKNTVRQKGGMFDSDSDPNAHLSSEEGEAT